MTDFSQSAACNSYLGSVLSLISKSEIRYQGVLSHVDTVHSSIGLQNVRSFGTEGRRKDGPQILPSDKVYDYIYFRGTDVKDLQVLSSPPPQSAPAMLDDPAIISTNYKPPAPASLLPAGTGPVANFSSNTQLGLPDSTFRPMGSWFPSSPQISNDSGRASSPLYWQGYNGPSSGQPTSGFVGSPSQQIPYSVTNNGSSSPSSFFQLPSSLLPSFSNGSLDNRTTVFPPNSSSLNLSVGGSTLLATNGVHNHLENIQPTFISSSKFTPLVSSSSPFLMDTNPAVPPIAYSPNSVVASASPSQGIFTYMPSIDETSVTSPASASNHAASASPSQGIFTYMPSVDETPVTSPASASSHAESAMPSLMKAENLLESMPSSFSSSLSLQTDQKDIEVVQTSKSESLSTDAKEERGQLKGASVHPHHHDKRHEGGKEPQQQKQGGERKQQQQERGVTEGEKKGFHGADARANQGMRTWHGSKDKFPRADSRGNQGTRTWHASKDKFHVADSRDNQGVKTWHTSKDKLNGAVAHYHHSNRPHGQGREKEFYGGAKHSHLSYKSHVTVNGSSQPPYHGIKSHERQNWVSGASSSPKFATKGLARGKRISQPVMKFTEDFDFEAMNEKFDKDEVWGQLGKSYKTESNKKEDPIGSNEDGQCQEDIFVLPKTETKIYIKDDFFDSLSHGDTLNRKLKEGKIKLSDRKKLDIETFGDDVQLNRGAHSGMQRGRGGQSCGHGHTRMVETFDGPQLKRGSRSGRGRGGRSSGLGRTGRVEGRAVWCRVT